MGWAGSSFHRSSEARRHLDPRSLRPGGSGAKYAWSTDVTLVPSLKQWHQYYRSTTRWSHQERVPLRAC